MARFELSRMSAPAKWTCRLLAPLILGALLASALWYPFMPDIENDELQWANMLWVRLGIGVVMVGYALWLSSRLSRLQEWVFLEAGYLVAKGLWSRRARREALDDVKRVHENGCIEFASGFRVQLEDHRSAEARRILDKAKMAELKKGATVSRPA